MGCFIEGRLLVKDTNKMVNEENTAIDSQFRSSFRCVELTKRRLGQPI